jgi:PPM family protein phosphatase
MLRVADHYEKTDTGRQRRANEDSLFARSPLFAVADGMGGAQAGEVASRTAVAAFEAAIDTDGDRPVERVLAERVQAANAEIYDLSRSRPELAGMGTTLTALYVGEDDVTFAHVGDSRAYVLRDAEMVKLTKDHSLVDELVEQGELTPEEAEHHPQRSVITRALGPEPIVDVDTGTFGARAGDVYLLCSDGLTTMVAAAHVKAILCEHERLGDAARALIAAANAAGGRDNITVVLVRLEDVDPGLRTAPEAAEEVDQPTVVESADAVREALEDAPARRGGVATATAPASRVRGEVEARVPRRPAAVRSARRRWLRRFAFPIAALVALGVVVLALWIATQSVYFVGTDGQGLVTIYRGLPYELPLGLKLYTTDYESGVPAASVQAPLRRHLLDNSLRSHDDATSLVRQLELGQLQVVR